MAKYKVIYRNENCSWSEGCPVRVSVVQVSRDTTSGACYLQTRLRNISNNRCSSVEFVVNLANDAGDAEKIEFKLLDADLPAGATMAPRARKMTLSEVCAASATITRVDDARHFGAQLQIPKPEAPNLSEELLAERKTLLAENGVNAKLCTGVHVTHQRWWMCGCGAANVQRSVCWNCQAPLELLRNADSADYLAEHAMQRSFDAAVANLDSSSQGDVAAAIENLRPLADKGFRDSAEKIEAGKKRLSEMQRGRKRALRITVAILVASTIGFSAFEIQRIEAQKETTYETATACLEAGNYNDAQRLFESLGDYRDSADKANEAASPANLLYQRALRELESGDNTKALEHFDSLGDYKDSVDKANEARETIYQKAASAFDSGKYSIAAGMFETVGDYADAPQRAEEARGLAYTE